MTRHNPSDLELRAAVAIDAAETMRRVGTFAARLKAQNDRRPVSPTQALATWTLQQLPVEDPRDTARRRAVLAGYEPAGESAS